ncbi:SDR family NAD(P)-dependent oxidoreductase, partial [Achromobacter insolitus]
MPRALEGKTILITGAAGGIGQATAEVCAEQGASLVLADREAPQELAERLARDGAQARAIAFDVTDRAAA